MPPKPIPTRWTSLFEAVEYHKEFLPYEKAFLALEENCGRFGRFLQNHYKLLNFQTSFIHLRCQFYIRALEIFESDIGDAFLVQDFLDKIGIEIHSQSQFASESVDEVMENFTVTFDRAEKEKIVQTVRRSAVSAEKKFLKYFDDDTGEHPSKTFLREVRFFYPQASLGFDITPNLTTLPEFSRVPQKELEIYRAKARFFVSKLSDLLFNFEVVEAEVQNVRDFWSANRNTLPNLYKLAEKYAYLVATSAAVERAFSFYNKLLSDDRRRLDEATLDKLLFIYFNVNKL